MKNIKQKLNNGFSLVEIILVVAVVVLFAATTLVLINPNKIFNKGKEADITNDLKKIQIAMQDYLITDTVTSTPRYLTDLPGYTNMVNDALNNNTAKCPNGINGVGLQSISGAYSINNTTSTSNLDISPVINSGKLQKLLKDPDGNLYKACIDTTNSNFLVIYSPNVSTSTNFIFAPVLSSQDQPLTTPAALPTPTNLPPGWTCNPPGNCYYTYPTPTQPVG